jgi:hypothetical protein
MKQPQLVDPVVYQHQHRLHRSFFSLAGTADGEKERSDGDEALDTHALIEGAYIDLLIQPLYEDDNPMACGTTEEVELRPDP